MIAFSMKIECIHLSVCMHRKSILYAFNFEFVCIQKNRKCEMVYG